MSKLHIDEAEEIEEFSSYPDDQETVVSLGLLRQLHPTAMLDLLGDAYNGLKWYRDAHPDDDSGADDELYARIEAALARPAATPAPAAADGSTPGAWFVRKRERNGELLDCFIAAPDCSGFAYDAEILGDDEYREDAGIARKLADCELIVRLVNAHRAQDSYVMFPNVDGTDNDALYPERAAPVRPTNQALTQALQEMVAEAEKHDRSAYCELGFDEETLNRARAALASPGA